MYLDKLKVNKVNSYTTERMKLENGVSEFIDIHKKNTLQ